MDQQPSPHVTILPYPLQGHIKRMLNFAKLLCHANFQVTFINSDYNHTKMFAVVDIPALQSHFPGLSFESIPDGVPPHVYPPTSSESFFSSRSQTKMLFKQLLISLRKASPSCIIVDVITSFAIDVAKELDIPVFTFSVVPACCIWVGFHFSTLIEQGQVPITSGDLDMDKAVTCIPGMENVIRRRDLPSFCRCEEANDPVLQFFDSEIAALPGASGLILNSFDGLEGPMITELGCFINKIYTIGPVHGLLETFINQESSMQASSGCLVRKEDTSCITWLDSQASKSVIYVSFGSFGRLFHDHLLEFWHGLVNSGKPFLWVIRRGLINGEDGVGQLPRELQVATKERGCIVDWAPQEEVLAHPAIGGFLTHSGWNSIMETIFAGVPMICWPIIGDQQVNSRVVSEVWKIGYDIKDTCNRSTIEITIRDLMQNKRQEMIKSMDNDKINQAILGLITRMAHDSIKKGGSSYCNLEKLIEDIKLLCSQQQQGTPNSNP